MFCAVAGTIRKAVDPGECHRGEDESDMNNHLPEHSLMSYFFRVNERFKQVNGRDADEGHGQLHFEQNFNKVKLTSPKTAHESLNDAYRTRDVDRSLHFVLSQSIVRGNHS